MEVFAAKLVTREFVIGQKVEGGLNKVLAIVPTMMENNKVAIRLVPYVPPMFKCTDSPEVKNEHIMSFYEVDDDLRKAYVQEVTGLKIVPSMDVVEKMTKKN